MVRGFSPLDEELGLAPGHFTPRLQESLTRLGSWMPFRHAAQELEFFTGVPVSEATARRITEQAGAAYVKVQTDAVEELERTLPPPPAGPARQFLSVDGAFVPVVGGEWTEVKTLALGVIAEPVLEQDQPVVHTHDLSYFSRHSEAHAFTRLALVETHRRGVETAQRVIAVTDGAEWLQGFIDFHRRDAVRILDFPHAAEYVAQAGRVVYGEATPDFSAWFEPLCHRLKHHLPDDTLAEIRSVLTQAEMKAVGPDSLATVQTSLHYLETRRAMIAYADFQQQGYPIGDGCVESANKLVVESRMKQAGMRWAEVHINPLVALRTVVCNDRWSEAWPQVIEQLRQQARQRTLTRREQRAQAKATPLPTPQPGPLAVTPAPSTSVSEPAPISKVPYRPAPDHIWRRSPIGRAQFLPTTHAKS